MCLGLLLTVSEALDAARWELSGPHRGPPRSSLLIVVAMLYLIGGFLLGRTHSGLRPAAIWLLVVFGSLGLRVLLPLAADKWAHRRHRPSEDSGRRQ